MKQQKKNELTSDMQSVTIPPVLGFCVFHNTVAFFVKLSATVEIPTFLCIRKTKLLFVSYSHV